MSSSSSVKKSTARNRPWRTPGGIRIRPLKNDSGTYSYRTEIPESVTGKRILKQFKTPEEAESYASVMLVTRQNNGLAAFTLTDEQRADARKALDLLSPCAPVTLTQTVQFYRKHFLPEGGDVSVEDLVEKYLAEKESQKLRPKSLKDLACRLRIFTRTFGKRLVKEVSSADLKAWLVDDKTISDQTKLNYRRILHGLFTYAIEKKYLAANPAASLKIAVETSEPGILTLGQVACLLQAALDHPELELGSHLTLALFCGIRFEELSKVQWEDVKVSEKFVTISKQIAKKRRIRNIPLERSAIAWLSAFGARQSGPVSPPSITNRLAKLIRFARELAAKQKPAIKWFDKWPTNAFRHSFASYFYAKSGNAAETCARLGQRSDDVLFQHYRTLVTKKDGARYFEIMPPGAKGKVVSLLAMLAA